MSYNVVGYLWFPRVTAQEMSDRISRFWRYTGTSLPTLQVLTARPRGMPFLCAPDPMLAADRLASSAALLFGSWPAANVRKYSDAHRPATDRRVGLTLGAAIKLRRHSLRGGASCTMRMTRPQMSAQPQEAAALPIAVFCHSMDERRRLR
jgi:hypothetical protein